ncbi:MAG TPA: ABC transporter permease [Opitutaceae bacterium]|jgi:ABC-2 type transport system permease protein|nr:ABC transporter permease [Opitutaceae bacterium]
MIRGIYAIVVLDLKRAWLDRARMISGLAQPLLYLFILGAGLGASSKVVGYQRYIFPGVIGLNLLFTATFSAITIVFDRQIGFFKAVLVAPLPRASVAFGKIAAGGLQAFVQALLILPFAPLVKVPLGPLEVLELLGAMLLGAMVFSAMGVAVAARFTSTTVFPIVSNAVLLPMFFLSGALYPLKGAPRWIFTLSYFDPVAYSVDLMRGTILHQYAFAPWLSLAAQVGFILVLAALAVQVFNRGEDDSSLGATQFRWRR